MDGLEKYVAPSSVVVLVTHPDQVGSLGQARDVQVGGQHALYLRVKGPVGRLQGDAIALSGIGVHEIFGTRQQNGRLHHHHGDGLRGVGVAIGHRDGHLIGVVVVGVGRIVKIVAGDKA